MYTAHAHRRQRSAPHPIRPRTPRTKKHAPTTACAHSTSHGIRRTRREQRERARRGSEIGRSRTAVGARIELPTTSPPSADLSSMDLASAGFPSAESTVFASSHKPSVQCRGTEIITRRGELTFESPVVRSSTTGGRPPGVRTAGTHRARCPVTGHSPASHSESRGPRPAFAPAA